MRYFLFVAITIACAAGSKAAEIIPFEGREGLKEVDLGNAADSAERKHSNFEGGTSRVKDPVEDGTSRPTVFGGEVSQLFAGGSNFLEQGENFVLKVAAWLKEEIHAIDCCNGRDHANRRTREREKAEIQASLQEILLNEEPVANGFLAMDLIAGPGSTVLPEEYQERPRSSAIGNLHEGKRSGFHPEA